MPEIPVGAQIFDLTFHPTHAIVYTGLLTGEVKAFSYNAQGGYESNFTVRPTKRSCRGLSVDHDGAHLYAVGKSKAFSTIDTKTEQVEVRKKAHEAPINRVKCLTPWLLSTGDDDGVIKLWDPRQRECTRTYHQHFDYITDFLWLEDKKQLVATSGDGTLSVMDVRSKKQHPFAQSEDQEDELLSITSIKGATKVVIGTQLGILSIFNRSSGWGDCVDRVPGHPHSIDALCSLPPSLPDVDTSSTVLTGSSDGFVRAVQLFPTKLLGVIADHGEMPVERIALGGGEYTVTLEQDAESELQGGKSFSGNRVSQRRGVRHQTDSDDDVQEETDGEETSGSSRGVSRWWVGSVGHEEVLRLTDLVNAFELKDDEDQDDAAALDLRIDVSDDGELSDRGRDGTASGPKADKRESDFSGVTEADGGDSNTAVGVVGVVAEVVESDDSDASKAKKRKRKEKNLFAVKKRKPGRNELQTEQHFFSDL